jgi:hypothetical protein
MALIAKMLGALPFQRFMMLPISQKVYKRSQQINHPGMPGKYNLITGELK